MIGETVSHYSVLESIGRGGMGMVYLAEDARLHRKVALKFLPPAIAKDSHARARFVLEAQAACALDHPNIATIYEIGDWHDQLFIAMAFYEGETLKSRIERGPLDISEIARITEQLASGLALAHAAGIVHRDLKPANVLLRRDGQVKILDFGLAKLLTVDETMTRITVAGTTVGTVAYMSPEQAEGHQVNTATDVWAVGVILYEMLTGRLPFIGSHGAAMMSSILSDTPSPVTTFRSDVPTEINQIVGEAFVKDPKARTLTAQQIADRVAAYRLRVSSSAAVDAIQARARGAHSLSRWIAIPAAAAVICAAAVTGWALKRNADIRWATGQALPEITRLSDQGRIAEAFTLAQQAERYIPGNEILAKVWPIVSRSVSIDTEPEGADVGYRPYEAANGGWIALGRTPIAEARVPKMVRWRIAHSGFSTVEDATVEPPYISDAYKLNYRLVPEKDSPVDMVRVSSGGSRFSIYIAGLDDLPAVELPDYWIDRYEVTNRQFKEFVSAGGYQRREFWKEPFTAADRVLPWEEAISRFHDATGRPGPAMWELGDYPEGQGDYPVTGVSWYEAAAYSAFRGKSLPSVFHWSHVANQRGSASIVPLSNFAGRGPWRAGTSRGMNRFGAYDLAGNVKEWCLNAEVPTKHYILGGAWNEPVYEFTDGDARSSFDRDANFGFRCVRLGPEPLHATITGPLAFPSRDWAKEQPVDDATFNTFRRMYSYDKGDLNVRREAVDNSESEWSREKISLNAAYGNERFNIFVYLPKTGKPPYQAIIYFPGSSVLREPSFEAADDSRVFDYILKSGRAFVYPVYKSTFDRQDGMQSDVPNATNLWRDHVIMWSKDLGRTLDYLQTRPDIASDKCAYLGASWGAQMGAILPAVETRFKAVVLLVGGFNLQKSSPEVEPINFAPRITAPTLMLNGKYDFFFPTEASQVPMFRFLGAQPDQKRRVVYDTGHSIPRTERIKETLDWLDRYLGPITAIQNDTAR